MSDDQLPAVPAQSDIDQARPVLPGRFAGLAHDIGVAQASINYLNAAAPRTDSDMTVLVLTAVLFAGSTQEAALQAVADWKRETGGIEIHHLGWAKVPGTVEGVSEWHCTVAYSTVDRDGETTGSTHNTRRDR